MKLNRWEKAGAIAIGAGLVWYKTGMWVPWKVYRQFGNAIRRRMENSDVALMHALHKYEAMNPGSISDEVLSDVEMQFTETMIDNDVMGVWNSFFKRKHPYVPNTEVVLDVAEREEEDDDE